MRAALEIVRAAALGLGRTLWPWLLGGTALALLMQLADPSDLPVALTAALAVLWAVVLPLVTARGLRRWVNAGPLGLSARGGGYLAAAGFGLGASLVVLPFGVLAAWRAGQGARGEGSLLAVVAVGMLTAAFSGAGAGRVVGRPLPVLLVSWLLFGGTCLATVGLSLALQAGYAGHLLRMAYDAAAIPVSAGLGLSISQLVLLGMTAAGPRLLPSQLES